MKLKKFVHHGDYYSEVRFSDGARKSYDFTKLLSDKYQLNISDLSTGKITDRGLYLSFNNGLIKIGWKEFYYFKLIPPIENDEKEISTISSFSRLYQAIREILKI
jgi:hypothetical protein